MGCTGEVPDSVAEVVVCRTRTSYSRCPARVSYYRVVVREEAVVRSGVVRRVVLVVAWLRRARWDSEEEVVGCWSLYC